jgi:adenosyl cobinamide kinase/adenosyl cobinamide phosphate guanylyltransferase
MGQQKNKELLFFLGGARSGKTAAAEAKAMLYAENMWAKTLLSRHWTSL